ncbi:hypothetical protein L484_027736 [Morus notabilis]|uniref:Uncharacterized protein n=1 Tax=Morus notabilis TaxID=981085 RepID=W9S1M2_9ROSA|nr:hypothetical protein L484_027736 [Morus notabilis]
MGLKKKLAFPEQFLWLKTKVLSGFGLGVVVSVLALAVLLLSHFLKGPSVQGFQSVTVNNSHTSSNENVNVDGKVPGLVNTQLSNFTQEVKNGSSVVEEKTLDGNASFSGKEGAVIEKTIASTSLSDYGNEDNNGGQKNSSLGNVFDKQEEKAIMEASRGGNWTEENSLSIAKVSTNEFGRVQNDSYEDCNIFDGNWVRDDSKPYYPGGSCPYIDRDFDCYLNRRPDDGYVKWRWQPYGCDIPSLNATDFLERLRGKKLVFVGDSLNRNMWESLDYNCTVDFVGSPFLVRESSFTRKNGSFETLRIDLMDRTTSMYHDADIIVFNTGHWWTHEKTSRGEDYYQEGNHVYPRLKVLEAYKRALKTWAKWVNKNIDTARTKVFFRGYSVTHFKGGQWNSGGQCHKETEPIFNKTYLGKYTSKMRAFDNVLREMKTPVIYLNISRLTDYRKDGHPSIYRMIYKSEEEQMAAVTSQDCSHWCLPGVPDTWNELLYASLLKAKWGS